MRVVRVQPRSDEPTMPDWLPESAKATWDAVIADLIAAKVPTRRVDNHAIGHYVLAVIETAKAAKADDMKLAARLGRDAMQWANLIGATPLSRARLGIKAGDDAPKIDAVDEALFA